jgi:hypothetical protein
LLAGSQGNHGDGKKYGVKFHCQYLQSLLRVGR